MRLLRPEEERVPVGEQDLNPAVFVCCVCAANLLTANFFTGTPLCCGVTSVPLQLEVSQPHSAPFCWSQGPFKSTNINTGEESSALTLDVLVRKHSKVLRGL